MCYVIFEYLLLEILSLYRSMKVSQTKRQPQNICNSCRLEAASFCCKKHYIFDVVGGLGWSSDVDFISNWWIQGFLSLSFVDKNVLSGNTICDESYHVQYFRIIGWSTNPATTNIKPSGTKVNKWKPLL